MLKRLTRTGNTLTLAISKEMRAHLDITDEIEIQMLKGRIVLTKPINRSEAFHARVTERAEQLRPFADECKAPLTDTKTKGTRKNNGCAGMTGKAET